MNWLCNNIQCVFFLLEENKDDALEIWKKIIGGDPSMFFKDGSPNPMNYSGAILGGPCDTFSIILGLQKTRLDLWVTPLGLSGDSDLPPNLPDIDSAISVLVSKCKLIAENLSFNRLGVLTSLAKFFETEEDAIVDLQKNLGGQSAIPVSAKEVNVRYNVVSNESISNFNFSVNNIINFNIFKHRSVNLQISEGNISATTTSTKEYAGLSKNVDINLIKLKSAIPKKYTDEIIDFIFARSQQKYNED